MADAPGRNEHRTKHVDAYCLVTYFVEETQEEEIVWNSRDGATPSSITSRNGYEANRSRWRQDRYAPEHVPAVGDRIFVDLTEVRARALIAEAIAQRRSTPEGLARLEQLYASPEEAFERLLKNALENAAVGAPDILVVTAGYLESLEQKRRSALDPTRAPLELLDPAQRSSYYDRKCQPIGVEDWIRLSEDRAYKIVARVRT